MELYPIWVDDREQAPSSAQIVAGLHALGASAEVRRLDVADYMWRVCNDKGQITLVQVEHKSIADLLSSVADGRLTRFVDETGGVDNPDGVIRALLVEGNQFAPVSFGRDWQAEALDNTLAEVQMCGVIVLRCPSPAMLAQRLYSFWKWTGKETHTLFAPTKPALPPLVYSARQRRALQKLMTMPGWGLKRCEDAVRGLGSPGAVVRAVMAGDVKAFAGIRGIGKKLVEDARDEWEEVYR